MQVPCEGARQLRCAVVRLWGCGDDDFWMLCEGRALADDMKVPQSGSHVQVRLRGVAIFSQSKIQQMYAIYSFEVAAWFNTFGEIRVNVKFTHPNSGINSR